jgi:hypothetical protein
MKIRSNKGVEIDFGAIMARNEETVAVGNANMNARGDILGRDGQVVKSRDEVAQEYHRANPNAVKRVSLKDIDLTDGGSDQFGEFEPVVDAVERLETEAKKKRKSRKIEDTDD